MPHGNGWTGIDASAGMKEAGLIDAWDESMAVD